MASSILLLLVAALAISDVTSENIGIPFQKAFQILHQEPPPPERKTRATVETLLIDQKLDQFNPEDDRIWKMRYMANSEFYQEGGPLFIFVGGEWEISEGFITGGLMYDMAEQHNGYLFYTEHRYYGESRPTENLSNENIKYLNVRQALADLAHFIKTMKETIPGMANSKVILVGGSYSATMVTWFKRLYPELATGCWASSAPLLAKANFIEYKEITGQSIRLLGGSQCYDRIQNGIAELEDMFANKRGSEVKAMFKLCSNFDETNDLDLWTFFSEISDIFAGVVQTHNEGQIEGACKQIMEEDSDVKGLAKFLMLIIDELSNGNCLDSTYKTSLASIVMSTYSDNIFRQWLYQTCNEYGWYQTSGSRNQPFGTQFPLALYTTICYDAYGSEFTNTFINKQIDDTNEYFGGLEPAVDNVYMTHGHLDPWRAMGIQTKTEATVIPNYAHCKDFGSISDKDSPEMKASKEKIVALVAQWVAE